MWARSHVYSYILCDPVNLNSGIFLDSINVICNVNSFKLLSMTLSWPYFKVMWAWSWSRRQYFLIPSSLIKSWLCTILNYRQCIIILSPLLFCFCLVFCCYFCIISRRIICMFCLFFCLFFLSVYIPPHVWFMVFPNIVRGSALKPDWEKSCAALGNKACIGIIHTVTHACVHMHTHQCMSMHTSTHTQTNKHTHIKWMKLLLLQYS